MHKIGTAGAQQYLDFLDRFSNCAARLAGLKLALQLEEGPVGAIETLRENRFGHAFPLANEEGRLSLPPQAELGRGSSSPHERC